MPGFTQDHVDPSGTEYPASFLEPLTISAKVGDGFMHVDFARFIDAGHTAFEPLETFGTTVPLGSNAQALLQTLFAIMVEAAMSATPPTGLDKVTPAP